MIRLRILEILKEQGHTKYWLWKQISMSQQNFNKVITNQTGSFKFETLEQLMAGLGCPIGDLFEIVPEDGAKEMDKADKA